MSLFPAGTFSGHYTASTKHELANYDIVIGHEFGAPSEGVGVVNEALAEIIAEHHTDKPIYAAHSIASALKRLVEVEIAGELMDTSSNTTATVGGTWEELQQVWDLVDQQPVRSLHIGQAHHIGRIAQQAQLVGFKPVVPEGLPATFDRYSSQWWCRGPVRWAVREIPGSAILRAKGHL